jgi:hypothetical protein
MPIRGCAAKSGRHPGTMLTLGDVARECPDWHCYAGVTGLLYARLRHSSPPLTVTAATLQELLTKIREAEAGLR